MDRQYWEAYYAAQAPSEQPSSFARFCAERYKPEHGQIFDIGCGNGRDSLFFASRSIPCAGIDQCGVAIAKCEAKKSERGLAASFHVGDFSAKDYDSLASGPYSIYSRFTLHAVNYEEEDRLFRHLDGGKRLGYLFIEARSIRDGLYGQGKEVGPHEFVTSHYRRFIDPAALKAKLERNFVIEHMEEAQGFARIETEDPCLIRVIAKRR
jgi:SAM-dependent methyltransferase